MEQGGGSKAARQQGSKAARQQGSKAARQQGDDGSFHTPCCLAALLPSLAPFLHSCLPAFSPRALRLAPCAFFMRDTTRFIYVVQR
ncbi:MAG: hypothetical protein FJ149_03365 [Euryarchaeota archaeon]|nr:hypothetical protein [Euryarchaeota archaeon]